MFKDRERNAEMRQSKKLAAKPKVTDDSLLQALSKIVLEHPALPACKTMDDVELIAGRPLPETLSNFFQEVTDERGEPVGIAMLDLYEESQMAKIHNVLAKIMLNDDGTKRVDASQRISVFADLYEIKDPEARSRAKDVFESIHSAYLFDENGNERSSEGKASFLDGLQFTQRQKKIMDGEFYLDMLRKHPGIRGKPYPEYMIMPNS